MASVLTAEPEHEKEEREYSHELVLESLVKIQHFNDNTSKWEDISYDMSQFAELPHHYERLEQKTSRAFRKLNHPEQADMEQLFLQNPEYFEAHPEHLNYLANAKATECRVAFQARTD